MNINSLSHKVAEEDYTYLSGFLKAKEVRFLNVADYTTLSRMMTLPELIEFVTKFGYHVSKDYNDPMVFEKSLWKQFEEELKSLDRIEPETFLSPYLDSFRKILFWKSDESVFATFLLLSKQGTDLTQSLARYVVDRFNFFEKIRSVHDQTPSWNFMKEGNLSQDTINQLIDSNFQKTDLSTDYVEWKSFIAKESPIKSFDFPFSNRMETFWKTILERIVQKASFQIYGLDYCISYFLTWILEMEAITKVYFTLRFSLHYDLREELYLHVR